MSAVLEIALADDGDYLRAANRGRAATMMMDAEK
jgi:hypothetical protein